MTKITLATLRTTLLALSIASAIALGLTYHLLNKSQKESPSDLLAKLLTVQEQLSITLQELLGHIKFTDYAAVSKKASEGKSRFLAAKVDREYVHVEHIQKSTLGIMSGATIMIKYAVEYSFGFDLRPAHFAVSGSKNGITIALSKPDPKPVPPWVWRGRPKNSLQPPSPIQQVAFMNAQTVTLDDFFKNLKRPTSPNNWLVAPADFVIKPDAVAPVFDAPVSGLREAFKSAVLRSKEIAVVAETENAMHLVATTSLMRFQDDIRVLFIPVASDKSTIALFSASRVGYWDLGTNRRRVEDWIKLTGNTLVNAKR